MKAANLPQARRLKAQIDAETDRLEAWEEALPFKITDTASPVAAEWLSHPENLAEMQAVYRAWGRVVAAQDALTEAGKPIKGLLGYVSNRWKEIPIDRQEFLDEMSQPDAPDQMQFVVRRDDSLGVSREAVEALAYQVHDFMLARYLGTWQQQDDPPPGITLNVQVKFDPPRTDAQLEQEGRPWFSLDDGPEVGSHITSPDGAIRLEAFLAHLRPTTEGEK